MLYFSEVVFVFGVGGSKWQSQHWTVLGKHDVLCSMSSPYPTTKGNISAAMKTWNSPPQVFSGFRSSLPLLIPPSLPPFFLTFLCLLHFFLPHSNLPSTPFSRLPYYIYFSPLFFLWLDLSYTSIPKELQLAFTGNTYKRSTCSI